MKGKIVNINSNLKSPKSSVISTKEKSIPNYSIARFFLHCNHRLELKLVLYCTLCIVLLIVGCGQKKIAPQKIDMQWLNEIKKNSDTIYTKPYYRTDFVTAEYFCNTKDSAVCQLMKDSAGAIRQVIQTIKNKRTFFAQYYKNGQLVANLPLDDFGQYHGESNTYFESGKLQSEGKYQHGLKVNDWEFFDESGKLISIEKYNNNGELIKTIKP